MIANQIRGHESHRLATHGAALRCALNRIGDSESVRHPCAVETRSAHRPRRGDRHLPLSRAKRRSGTTCRRRDSNPRHADYDSAVVWLCRAKGGRNGARMAHKTWLPSKDHPRLTSFESVRLGGQKPRANARTRSACPGDDVLKALVGAAETTFVLCEEQGKAERPCPLCDHESCRRSGGSPTRLARRR